MTLKTIALPPVPAPIIRTASQKVEAPDCESVAGTDWLKNGNP